MAISLDLIIFGMEYFAVLFYEWDSSDISNNSQNIFCMGGSL